MNHKDTAIFHKLFFEKIKTYCTLSEPAEKAWTEILHIKTYAKNSNLVSEGEIPAKVAFVLKGVFYQYYTSADGNIVTKYFFPERRIAASISAMLLGQPGKFTISALEKSVVMEYDFAAFKRLVSQHTDIAGFYISYMEQHWIIEKEPEEISLRHDSAATRYKNFVDRYPDLQGRLKQHHIASYLGITPEGLSRIKKDIAKKVFNTSNP
jgi:CRP-like cAMP-binding protein